MSTWLVEPRDTAVFRDGRPMADGAGVAKSLNAPWPSAIAGLCRTRIGMDAKGRFSLSPQEARAIAVRGPWWAEVKPDGSLRNWLVPAPADAVWHEEAVDSKVRTRLAPKAFDNDVLSDLPEGLLPVCPLGALSEGKASSGPGLWDWAEMEAWLTQPRAKEKLSKDFGVTMPVHEPRTHVAISGDSQTAEDGKLFSVDAVRPVARRGDAVVRLSWAFCCEDSRLKEGLVPLGGERRLSRLTETKEALPAMPKLAIQGGKLRVVLMTPGIFGEGFRPDKDRLGPGVEVYAAAVGRPLAISGWDFELNQPKASRRMAPAGSVYWLQFPSDQAALEWAKAHWWKPISDDAQDRLDGFGVCVVGVG